MFREFKPVIFFLLKFLGMYFIGNIGYGLYVTSWYPDADPVTNWVTHQTAWLLTAAGWESTVLDHPVRPTVSIMHDGMAVVSVYEGCNGINVMIVYLAFLIAFGSLTMNRKILPFAFAGTAILHVANLARIILLFFVTLYLPRLLYFTHKYLFTASIYVIVFVLWLAWIRVVRQPSSHAK